MCMTITVIGLFLAFAALRTIASIALSAPPFNRPGDRAARTPLPRHRAPFYRDLLPRVPRQE